MQRLVTEGRVKSVIDSLPIPSIGRIGVAIFDAGNASVFVRAIDIAIIETEISGIDSSAEMRQRLETSRCTAAAVLAMASSSEEALEPTANVPQIAFVSEPQDYRSVTAKGIKSHEMNSVVRAMSMSTLIRLIVTVAIGTSAAAMIEGTIVHEMPSKRKRIAEDIRLGHPGGVRRVGASLEKRGDMCIWRHCFFAPRVAEWMVMSMSRKSIFLNCRGQVIDKGYIPFCLTSRREGC